MAIKLAALTRGELRDYYDLLRIETDTDHRVEQGLSYFVARFQPDDPQQAVLGAIRAIGYLDDVEPDLNLPAAREEIAVYWQKRQPEILRAIGARGTPLGPPTPLRREALGRNRWRPRAESLSFWGGFAVRL